MSRVVQESKLYYYYPIECGLVATSLVSLELFRTRRVPGSVPDYTSTINPAGARWGPVRVWDTVAVR